MQEYLTQQIFLLLTGFGFEFMFNSSPIYVHLLNSLYRLTSPPRLDFNCQFVLYQPNSNTNPTQFYGKAMYNSYCLCILTEPLYTVIL